MFKKCLFVIVFVLFSSTLFAHDASEMVFSPKIGLGISKAYTDPFTEERPDLEFVWNIGAVFEYFLNSKISFIGELLYESQPLLFKNKYSNDTLLFNFSYITIPIGIHYFVPILPGYYLTLGGGLYYGFVCRSKLTEKIDGVKDTWTINDAKNDIGAFIDCGLNFELYNPGVLSVYLRFKIGVDGLLGENTYGYSTKIKPSTTTLNIAYGFKF